MQYNICLFGYQEGKVLKLWSLWKSLIQHLYSLPVSYIQCNCKPVRPYWDYYQHYQQIMYPGGSSWWWLWYPECVKPTWICSIIVVLVPLTLKLLSVSVKFTNMCPYLPQSYQVYFMVVPSLTDTSYSLCWPCFVELTHDIPRPPLPLQLPYPQPSFPLMPWIWPYLRINWSKVPAWEVG